MKRLAFFMTVILLFSLTASAGRGSKRRRQQMIRAQQSMSQSRCSDLLMIESPPGSGRYQIVKASLQTSKATMSSSDSSKPKKDKKDKSQSDYKVYSDEEKWEYGNKILAAFKPEATDEYSRQLRDQTLYRYIKDEIRVHKSQSTLFGNADQEPSEAMIAEIKRIGHVAQTRPVFIIYDADAKTAPYFREATGGWGLGISGRPHSEIAGLKHTVSLENPFLRYKLFSAVDAVTVSADSPVGQALTLAAPDKIYRQWVNEGDVHMFERIRDWAKTLEMYDLGLAKYDRNPEIAGAELLQRPVDESAKQKSVPDIKTATDTEHFQYWARHLFTSDIDDVFGAARAMTDSLEKLGEDAGQTPRLAAAILGSSQEHKDFVPLVSGAVERLGKAGFAIFTGGSSGFMRLANAIAVKNGADSIGIPIIKGKYSIKKESTVATDVHSMTLPAPDYSVRIPLLIRRPIVGFAPGGKGTMKELATLLVHMAAHPGKEQTQQVIFISSRYYEPLLKYFRESKLPPSILDQMQLIKDAP